MNHKYILLLSATMALLTGIRAQRSQMPALPCAAHPSTNTSDARPEGTPDLRGTAVWSEDFDNGIAGNNPSGAWTLDGPDGAIWHFGTTAPKGAFTPNSERIQSTTFANGFAKFASDSANCTWVGTTPTALPTADFTDWDGSLVSPVIDLSATPAVRLQFQQRMRYCCGSAPFVLEVTTDGFNTFTSILTDNGVPINTLSPTQTLEFSITGAIAADPSQVQFRFHHDGANAGTSHYHWQVDDINIVEAPQFDAHTFDGFVSHRGDGTEFGRIPQNQVGSTVNLGGFMDNIGASPLTNATLTAVVTDDASNTVQFTASTSTPTLTPGDTLLLNEFPNVSTLALGAYTVTYTASADETAADADTTNNVVIRTFEITGSGSGMVYSLDQIGGHPNGIEVLGAIGTADFTGAADELWGFTYYPIITDLTVDAIEVLLDPASIAGGLIRVAIHDSATVNAAGTNDDPNSPLIESSDYLITNADISNGGVTIPLLNEFTMTPGAYYAGAVMFSNAGTNDFGIVDDMTVPQPGLASAIYVPADQTYSNGEALAIRLRFGTVGIQENELKGVGVYPNPSTGLLNVTFTEQGAYTVELMNILGEIVSSTKLTGSSTLDLRDMAKGVYNLRISNNDATTVQRVVLN
jgi:Secretion system C-terminal sorting domain